MKFLTALLCINFKKAQKNVRYSSLLMNHPYGNQKLRHLIVLPCLLANQRVQHLINKLIFNFNELQRPIAPIPLLNRLMKVNRQTSTLYYQIQNKLYAFKMNKVTKYTLKVQCKGPPQKYQMIKSALKNEPQLLEAQIQIIYQT